MNPHRDDSQQPDGPRLHFSHHAPLWSSRLSQHGFTDPLPQLPVAAGRRGLWVQHAAHSRHNSSRKCFWTQIQNVRHMNMQLKRPRGIWTPLCVSAVCSVHRCIHEAERKQPPSDCSRVSHLSVYTFVQSAWIRHVRCVNTFTSFMLNLFHVCVQKPAAFICPSVPEHHTCSWPPS